MRRVLLAIVAVLATALGSVLAAGCGPDEPAGPDLRDYAVESR